MIVTDSGGTQEEATAPIICRPVLVIRLSTERPEAVEAGFARVVGGENECSLTNVEQNLEWKGVLLTESPYGDGTAVQKIVRILVR